MEYWIEGTEEKYIYYYYDESGISGISYCGTELYFQKNIFGDVIAIYDVNGNLYCTYDYDAWGNHKLYNQNGSEINKSTIHIGNINPIRYRGYYWDSEFGLYYLQSRYYSPEIGRFIQPDSVDYLEIESVNGLNLYCYCYNNPIMYIDDLGYKPKRNSKFVPRKSPRKGSENRQPTGARERNVGHPNGEEHSRVPKGNRVRKSHIELLGNELNVYIDLGIPQKNYILYENNDPIKHLMQTKTETNINSFPNKEMLTGVIVLTSAIVVVCIIGAIFTGGQTLWGLLAIV